VDNHHPFQKQQRFSAYLGLERITELCARLGDPHRQFRSIHIGGTNGKGSTAAFIANVLKHHGYRVGLFTSPHLVDYRERFRINDELIAAEVLAQISARVQVLIAEIEMEYPGYGPFTWFEGAAAVGFTYFAEESVDYAVIEVGLGGRFDATNILNPEITVITPIGHDHLDRLGPTLEDAAGEKAGIIKPNVPVIVSEQVPEVEQVLRAVAAGMVAPYYSLNDLEWRPLTWDLSGGELAFPTLDSDPFKIKLLGKHQLTNAATALLALQVLQQKGLLLESELIRTGLANTRWPGRLQVVSQSPLVLFDGAHNREGLAALAGALTDLIDRKITFVIGMSADKEPNLLEPLLPLAERIYFTEAQNSRTGTASAAELKDYAVNRGVDADCVALAQIPEVIFAHDPVCVCGSLYLIGDIQAAIFEK